MVEKEIDKLITNAKYCYQHKDYERELEIWREVCRIQPDNPFFQHNIALALMNSGKYAEALELFDYLQKKYPRLSRVHNNRAKLLMRMGVELQYLIPIFEQALATSEDMGEFIRHFMNLCGCIAYGLDEDAEEGFSLVEGIFPQALGRVSPPDLLEKNTQTMLSMLGAYRHIALYRRAFAQRKWRAAAIALSSATTALRKMGCENFARGIDRNVRQYFNLCRETIGALETLGLDSSISMSAVVEKYQGLLDEAGSLIQRDKDSFHVRIVEILAWFMRGMIEALEFMVNPLDAYKGNNKPMSMVAKLSAVSYVDLGGVLVSLLRFIDRQCRELSDMSATIACDEHIFVLRDRSWDKVALFCNGLTFDFKDVDAALARDMLGWEQKPLEDAKLKMHGFKSFVERQAYKDILVDGKAKENVGRALLQAFLSSRSYREVPVRGGQTDILQFVKHGRFLYEPKVWRGSNYYQQGLRELGEYIIGETDDGQLIGIFYVIFDPTKTRRAESHLGGAFSIAVVEGKKVNVVIINLSLPQPSTKS